MGSIPTLSAIKLFSFKTQQRYPVDSFHFCIGLSKSVQSEGQFCILTPVPHFAETWVRIIIVRQQWQKCNWSVDVGQREMGCNSHVLMAYPFRSRRSPR